MSSYFLLPLALLSLLFLTSLISCSSIFLPSNVVSFYQNDRYSPLITDNEPRIPFRLSARNLRSAPYYPRANRNTWFRVSTYQQFKPSGSDEIPGGDHVMRWGR
ncbi:hypothetical protein I4U23_025023 [Adineta vaga]|nr:hypothetical protein I4U23_025023 [Adineta vaga]